MKLGFHLLAFLVILAACSPPSESQYSDQIQVEDNPTLQSKHPSILEDNSPADNGIPQDRVLDSQVQASFAGQFQSFFLDPNQVNIIDSSQAEWPDSCLGIDQPGVDCIPQITQGYIVILEANGLQFEYHTDKDGGQVQPATLGLIWTREGGENQLCDRLIIYLPDTAHAGWCQSGEMRAATVNLQNILSVEEYEHLIDSLRTYHQNTVNQPSSDEVEPVMVSLTFHGQGNSFPQSDDQLTLLNFAESIFARISP